jgi:Putative zinc-finger
MPHPDEGLIHAWLDGELDAAEAARVEALVASDPEWTAAAAEARGLIAASARIVGSLDRVPANVIPKAAAAPPRAPQARNRWMLRAAAVLVLIGGSAVVLNRSSVDGVPLTIPLTAPAPSVVNEPVAPPRAEQQKAAAAAPADLAGKKVKAASATGQLADSKSTIQKQELDAVKQKDVASNLVRPERRADAAPAAAPAPVAGAGGAASAARLQSFAMEKTAAQAFSCFSQRAPADSALRLIKLDAAALADSIRLEKLTLRGDTLAAVNGRLMAVAVRCPAP